MVGGEDITGSERVADAGGRQYHIDCAPGELARFILLVGDPDRVRAAEGMLRDVSLRRLHREFATITGLFEDTTVSLMSTGIGCDNTEIAVIEASQCVEQPTFIRVGSSGALQPHCHVGDLVISDRAVRRENTSLNYVGEDHVPRPHPDVLEALINAAESFGYHFHVGATCSTSSFYAGQGTADRGLPHPRSRSARPASRRWRTQLRDGNEHAASPSPKSAHSACARAASAASSPTGQPANSLPVWRWPRRRRAAC